MSKKKSTEKQEKIQAVLPATATVAKPIDPRGWRKWLFRLLAMTLVPAFFLVLLEGLLRLCGYGYPTVFFLPREIGGQSAFVENPDFGRRFFPPGLTRGLAPTVFPGTKPAGTYRIFILGESAALGYPDPSFHFGRILKAMLHDRYPDARFEVVNTAMVAINSHVILPIARECAAHEPDLFVVYMGNNEVVGPYGASGVLGPFSPSLPLIRASVRVKEARTGQLLANLIRLASTPGPTPHGWGGMPMFVGSKVPADDDRLPAVYAHFADNLQDICAAGRQAGASVVVCTVATNLKDSAPFASAASALTAEQAAAWKKIYEDGIAQESAGAHAAAVDCYRCALALDDKVADLHFRLGRCLAALKKPDEAHSHYVLARDLDALRFRADTGINKAIRTTAGGKEDEGVYLADVEQAFANASAGGAPGEALLYEHVHLTFEGNCLLARTVLEQIVRILPDSVRPRGEPAAPFLSDRECRERLPFTEWNRLKGSSSIAMMFLQPPFPDQLDHAERQERWRRRLDELKKSLAGGGAQAAVAEYRHALARNEGDFALHKDFAALLAEQGKLDEAAEQLNRALELVPHDYIQLSRLAEILGSQGKLDQALACAAESVKLMPDDPQLHNTMGRLLITAGKPDQAAASFRAALKLRPNVAMIHVNLGDALALQKQYDQALDEYNEALRLDPNLVNARHHLGRMFNAVGRSDLALHQFQEAVRIDPKQSQIHAELAAVLQNRGRIDEAITHMKEALRLRPNWPEGIQALKVLQQQD